MLTHDPELEQQEKMSKFNDFLDTSKKMKTESVLPEIIPPAARSPKRLGKEYIRLTSPSNYKLRNAKDADTRLRRMVLINNFITSLSWTHKKESWANAADSLGLNKTAIEGIEPNGISDILEDTFQSQASGVYQDLGLMGGLEKTKTETVSSAQVKNLA